MTAGNMKLDWQQRRALEYLKETNDGIRTPTGGGMFFVGSLAIELSAAQLGPMMKEELIGLNFEITEKGYEALWASDVVKAGTGDLEGVSSGSFGPGI